jgi:hypothetical protein
MKTSHELILFKIDYKSKKAITISVYVLHYFFYPQVILDQSNGDRFLIYNPTLFVLGQSRELDIDVLKCPKLMSNRMHGFRSLASELYDILNPI